MDADVRVVTLRHVQRSVTMHKRNINIIINININIKINININININIFFSPLSTKPEA